MTQKPYNFCSREFYDHIKKSKPNNHKTPHLINKSISNTYCHGYCKKICKLFVKNCEHSHPSTSISKSILQFIYSNNSKHKIKLNTLINIIKLIDIYPNTTVFNKYNNITKKIFLWNTNVFIFELLFRPQVIDINKLKMTTSFLWCLTMLIFRHKYLTNISPIIQTIYSEYVDLIPSYVFKNNISLYLSFIQRRSSKLHISPNKSKKISKLSNILTSCIRIFASKNMTKLISFYI